MRLREKHHRGCFELQLNQVAIHAKVCDQLCACFSLTWGLLCQGRHPVFVPITVSYVIFHEGERHRSTEIYQESELYLRYRFWSLLNYSVNWEYLSCAILNSLSHLRRFGLEFLKFAHWSQFLNVLERRFEAFGYNLALTLLVLSYLHRCVAWVHCTVWSLTITIDWSRQGVSGSTSN